MLDRFTAIQLLASKLTDEIVVTSLGANSSQLHAISPRKLNCYVRGGMGLCTSIGLGIAINCPHKHVICLDGDGSLLMNLGSLCTIGKISPTNLSIFVYDNKFFYGEPTATAGKTKIAKIAKAAGFVYTKEISDKNSLLQAYNQCFTTNGPHLLAIQIKLLNDRLPFPYKLANDFRSFKHHCVKK